ncbi:5-bromo-4-chloroindolyl phosphate hydrolysis family protein [Paragemmobacter straminiformis]|uniref:5-bromo-4-chloroindolyl phosphate hydrolysis family protein n=1 Tax=Paragemmobacter straminiformis TaxID=2045119 RepID=A0A842IDP7_9RHOB|nr:5-bromo-4-chloroindolyl phosphate hydrolysis family protein [Gemmobacter straminiformis]MBC2837018.1 5-bromo-4-chloroindolyl phosphate hydrolysis family protein [Gemmobacter straminiformis]
MAQRFGGKYSPTPQGDPPPLAPHRFDGKRPSPAGGRVNVFFVAGLFMLIPAFRGGPDALFSGLGATLLLLAAAWLTREGLIAEDAYAARTLARRPAIPRKLFAALLTGAGLALGATLSQPMPYPILFALAGAGLHLAAFGLDPMRDKGAAGLDRFQTDRVARAVDEAERALAEMRDAILRARDSALEARVDSFAATARALFRTVEGDPGDLTAARKYLSVYLSGARDATVKFADFYAASRDASARADYLGLLDDLETNFASRTRSLLTNNRSDLDVEIGVLRERLQREG